MRLPRDIRGDDLARLLERYGYTVTRQTGSHMRLTTSHGGQHHITIPRHNVLRIGTLRGILLDVGHHMGIEWPTLLQDLFEKW